MSEAAQPASSVREPQQAPAGRIDDADLAVEIDDDEAGREARDDLQAQPLGGLGPRRHRTLLRLELRDRVLERRRQQRVLHAALTIVATHVARGGRKAQHGEHEDGDEAADDARQPDQGVGLATHGVIARASG